MCGLDLVTRKTGAAENMQLANALVALRRRATLAADADGLVVGPLLRLLACRAIAWRSSGYSGASWGTQSHPWRLRHIRR